MSGEYRHCTVITLYDYLANQYGADHVGSEQPAGFGNKIDLVVNCADNIIYYEIKTAKSAKACIRQAFAQLMEYAYWTCEDRASRLVIVSQNPLDAESKNYLDYLNSRFRIPITYSQYHTQEKRLISYE